MKEIIDFLKEYKSYILIAIVVFIIIFSVTAIVEGNVSLPDFNE
jgi:hypothetical protein